MSKRPDTDPPANPAFSKRMRFSGKTIPITIAGQEEFHVHELLLKRNSPFFRAALDKKWKEGEQGVIELPDDEIDVVAAYVEWTYTGKIDWSLGLSSREWREELDGSKFNFSCLHLCKSYVFGEKIQDNKFGNTVIAALAAIHDNTFDCIDVESTIVIYAGTPVGSPARAFITKLWATWGNSYRLKEGHGGGKLSEVPDFTRDLAIELWKSKRPTSGPRQVFFAQRKTWYKLG